MMLGCPSHIEIIRLGGDLMHEPKMMTVVATLKPQKRNVLEDLTSVGSAPIRDEKAPPLLPNPANQPCGPTDHLNGYIPSYSERSQQCLDNASLFAEAFS